MAADAYGYTPNVSLSLPLGNPCLPAQYHSLQSSPTICVSVTDPHTFDAQDDMRAAGYYSSRPNGAPTLESPRIEITAYGQFPEDEVEESSLPVAKRVNSIVTLTLPSADGYRDPSCLSPASSISSRSCHSDASYESSFSYNYDNSPQNSPWQSPSVSPKGSTLALPGDGCASGGSPRHSPSTSPRASITDDTWMGQRGSRPNSPCGAKRKYSLNGSGAAHKHYPYSPNHSPGLSPHTSPRLSVTEESWLPNTNQYTNSAILAAINALTTDGVADLGEGIPMKARKTSLEHSATVSLKVEPGSEELSPGQLCDDEHPSNRMALKKEGYCGGFLDVPQHPYTWSKPKQYVSPSLPALDWQLPSSSGPYSLQIDVQPKSHHRAHYETEGSRGAVKALAGGHPVIQLHGYMESEPLTLQLFIGTADDRLLRPHAFYQVHRITGKTVSTPSHEALHNNTKVLEIPLLPENNMRAIIDCAGILKLRNSDIELRKGETDIGRKNTRVRMVFRIHINQATGRTVSLQAASNPIECSQRSAQELPLVDKQSLETCPAHGGERMLLDGHNFQHDSKVVFVEKAQEVSIACSAEEWITNAACATSLLVEVPPYRSQRLSTPAHVNFYVCNGKRKRSQYQRFTYVPASVPTIKTEPHDDYDRTERRGPFDPSPEPPPNRLAPSFLMMASETRQPSGGRRLHDSDCSRATSSERSGTSRPRSGVGVTSARLSSALVEPSDKRCRRRLLSSSSRRRGVADSLQMTSTLSGVFHSPTLTFVVAPSHPDISALVCAAHLSSPPLTPFPPERVTNTSAHGNCVNHPLWPRSRSYASAGCTVQTPAPPRPEGDGRRPAGQPASQPAAIKLADSRRASHASRLARVNEIIRNDLSSISVHSHA
ncbi:putative nuclear factor of activated T-cells cytoplasmic 1-like [Scophthalmus maximus]|uniref:Putative nuclear factor of activated T-cells cytoplasmic 1-like n=1 Tax=Scophthalmus maximus TaxID=52904 RepID=A0A2U9CZQ8_SCOMX|nr:putative nuclear factor of activated T-cells cytoplasmic 1-like [Scophthalmus maximus]